VLEAVTGCVAARSLPSAFRYRTHADDSIDLELACDLRAGEVLNEGTRVEGITWSLFLTAAGLTNLCISAWDTDGP